MKNIHILPTDKPSRLFKFANQLHLDTIPKDYYKKYNIYITSDEQPKHNDYYTTDGKEIYYCNTLNPTRNNHYKKVILTTDQDLIAYGVQAIDDEFLEWFVKNPNCESVVVNFNYKKFRWSELNKSQCYKIIIPQEEPKQETLTYTEAAKKEERIFNSTMVSKQERNGKEINDRINMLLWIIGISFAVIIWLSILIAFNL